MAADEEILGHAGCATRCALEGLHCAIEACRKYDYMGEVAASRLEWVVLLQSSYGVVEAGESLRIVGAVCEEEWHLTDAREVLDSAENLVRDVLLLRCFCVVGYREREPLMEMLRFVLKDEMLRKSNVYSSLLNSYLKVIHRYNISGGFSSRSSCKRVRPPRKRDKLKLTAMSAVLNVELNDKAGWAVTCAECDLAEEFDRRCDGGSLECVEAKKWGDVGSL